MTEVVNREDVMDWDFEVCPGCQGTGDMVVDIDVTGAVSTDACDMCVPRIGPNDPGYFDE